MKVLVIGAHGQIGNKLVHKLKSSTHNPLAMVREEKQAKEFKDAGIEAVVADLEGDFEHAFTHNVDAVVFAAGSGPDTGADKTHLIDRLGAKKSVDFAIKNKIPRFILVSAMGADYKPTEWPKEMVTYYEAKADADKHLIQSNLDWTIILPGELSDEAGTNNVQLGSKLEQRTGKIPRVDVATVLEKVLDKENTYQKALELLSGKTPIDDAVEAIK